LCAYRALLAPHGVAIVRAMNAKVGTKRPLLSAASLAAVVVLGVWGAAPGAPQAQPAAAIASADRPFNFAHEVSDLEADPAVRFGVLPNGMRYAIRQSATPPGQAALRLRIAAGSLHEEDDQQGLAHFLEHMAFKGSKTVADGEMVRTLERLGLAFGADTNASTGYDETIYRLDLPRTDNETVDTALGLLRDVGSELLITQAALDSERGVVLSEERARDTPSFKVFEERFAFLLKDQRPPLRAPIGKVDVIRTASRERMLAFYHAYYRPERAVLVAVGDFDVDAMEARIRARFGDWQPVAGNGPDFDPGPVAPRGAEARLVVQPGVPTQVQMAWISPPDKRPDTVASRTHYLIRGLGLSVLNRRLASRARSGEPPFISASASRGDQIHTADIATLAATARPGEWQTALTALEVERNRLLKFGLRQDELDREIAEYRSAYDNAAASAGTRRTTAVAADILGAVSDNDVVTNPEQELAMFNAVVEGLQADAVTTMVREVFTGQGPLVFIASPTGITGGEKAILAALENAQKLEPTPPAAPLAGAWPYSSFGDFGKVAQRTEVIDLDTVFVTFENGVRLTVKPTKFRTEQIFVAARIGAGVAAMPADRQSPNWAVSAFAEGGLGKVTVSEMEGILASKSYGAGLGLDDTAFQLSGSTRPEDLPLQLEVLAAYAIDPGWRPEAFERVLNYGSTLHDQLEATSSGVLRRDLTGLLRSGDRRWTFPTREEIASTRLEDLKAVIDSALSNGAIEVVIVGDTTVEKAIDAVAATFGALPPRPAPQSLPPQPQPVRFPAGASEPIERTHNGRADQAIAYIAWPTADFHADPRRARAAGVLSDVLKLRLVEELRVRQGATYSPSVGYMASLIWPDYGYIAASEEAPPERLSRFFADVAKIAADLRDAPVSADELDRAKKPRIEGLLQSRQTNAYWLDLLAGAQTDPRRLDAIRSSIAGYEAITAADVQAAAKLYLRDDAAWKLVIRPKT
jgi:zinc protease